MPRSKEEVPVSEIPAEIIMPWEGEKFLDILTPTDRENVYRFAGFLPNTLLMDDCLVTSFALPESPYIQVAQLKEVVLFLTPDSEFSTEKLNLLVESYFREKRYYDKDFKWRFRPKFPVFKRRREVLIWPEESDNVERIRLLLRHFSDGLSFDALKNFSKENHPFVVFKWSGFDGRIYDYLEEMKGRKAPVPSCYPQFVSC